MIQENRNTKFSTIVRRLRRNKVSLALELVFVDWLNKHSMVIDPPIAKDTLLVPDGNNPSGRIVRMDKILLCIMIFWVKTQW